MVRLIALATISAPAMAWGEEAIPTLPVQWETGRTIGPALSDAVGGFPAQTHPIPCYWTVSSRGLPQDSTQCASARLCYYERLEDGSLLPTTREEMTGHFMPGVPICIFIHGSFVDAASHRMESAHTYNWIRRAAPQLPVHIIFYTWPSEARYNNLLASANPVAVNERGQWAENNAFYLVDLLAHLPHESPVCFVGHSHGARVTAATLHLAAGGQIGGRNYPYDTGGVRRYRAVMAAGAIDRHWLNPGERYDLAVSRAEGVLNMVNKTDAALHFYPLRRPFSRKAISATGLTYWDRQRLGPVARKVIDYDITRLIGLGHFWPNYYEEPSLAVAISPYVYFTDSQLNPTYGLVSSP